MKNMENEVIITIIISNKETFETVANFSAPTVDMAIEKLGAWERKYGGATTEAME